jgi:hypothetical protein
MNTTFQIGDTVQANSDAQGLVRDIQYTILDVIETRFTFGNFVCYVLNDPQDLDGTKIAVRNGHLLLSKVAA